MNNCVSLVLLALLAGCTGATGDADISSSISATFEEATAKDLFDHGWLPKGLPRSATRIVEVHNIDTGELWVSFRYSDNDIRQLTDGCSADASVRFPDAKRTHRNVSWWPEDLISGAPIQKPSRWLLYSCSISQSSKRHLIGIAVDEGSHVAWFWLVK